MKYTFAILLVLSLFTILTPTFADEVEVKIEGGEELDLMTHDEHQCMCGAFPNEGCAMDKMCDGSVEDCNKKCCNICKTKPNLRFCDDGCDKGIMEDDNDKTTARIACTGSKAAVFGCNLMNKAERLIGKFVS